MEVTAGCVAPSVFVHLTRSRLAVKKAREDIGQFNGPKSFFAVRKISRKAEQKRQQTALAFPYKALEFLSFGKFLPLGLCVHFIILHVLPIILLLI